MALDSIWARRFGEVNAQTGEAAPAAAPSGPDMPAQRAEILLPARGGTDLRATILSRADHAWPPFRWYDATEPVLERAEDLPGGSVYLLRMRPAARGVLLEVTGRDAREIEVLAPLSVRVRRALALDVDVAAFHRACRRDPILRPAARLGLGRLLRGTGLFEDAVTALVCAQATDAQARRALAALVALGRRCPARPGLRTFPSPLALARLPIRRLRDHMALGQAAAWISALARDVAAGRRDLAAIEHLPAREARRALESIAGLGPVGASWLVLLLGHHDEPVLDSVSRAVVRRAVGGQPAVRRWLRAQAPWRGLAVWLARRVAASDPDTGLRARRSPVRPGCRAARG
jgi:3-methyladenine DNA glycosylase/8-oxoguanine DNA glycosylase